MEKKEYRWKLADLKNIKKNGLKVFSTFSCGGVPLWAISLLATIFWGTVRSANDEDLQEES
ncbi:hypothetical protein AAGG52_04685 [Bacillus licheniformis]